MEKKKRPPSLFEQLCTWDSCEHDLLDDIGEHHDTAQELTSGPSSAEWQPKPVKHVENLEIASFQRLYPVFAVIMCTVMISVLLITTATLPRYGQADTPAMNEVEKRYVEDGLEETGAVNIVAGIILDYRAFDTLGESHVLFTAMCAVMILLMEEPKRILPAVKEASTDTKVPTDAVLRISAMFLFPAIMLFGIYIILNGHLSPGGGFSGGSIIGAGLILYSITYGSEKTERFMNLKIFRTICITALLFYGLSKGYSFYMGSHGLSTGIPEGIPGHILSAGLILPLNIAVGLVVACTMYGFYSIFRRGRI